MDSADSVQMNYWNSSVLLRNKRKTLYFSRSACHNLYSKKYSFSHDLNSARRYRNFDLATIRSEHLKYWYLLVLLHNKHKILYFLRFVFRSFYKTSSLFTTLSLNSLSKYSIIAAAIKNTISAPTFPKTAAAIIEHMIQPGINAN